MTTYTVGTEGNAYFNGRDGVLYKDGERIAKIALKDNRPAVYVKVYDWGTDATRELRQDLGDKRCESIAEGIAYGFWWYSGPELVREHENGSYEDLFGAGRSGGWAVPTSRRDHEWHWWDECCIDDPLEVGEGGADELSSIQARRYWFFLAAEALTAEVEYLRTESYDEAIRDAHYELEERREAALVRGEN